MRERSTSFATRYLTAVLKPYLLPRLLALVLQSCLRETVRGYVDQNTDLDLLLPKTNTADNVGSRGSVWLGVSLKFCFEHSLIFRATTTWSAHRVNDMERVALTSSFFGASEEEDDDP